MRDERQEVPLAGSGLERPLPADCLLRVSIGPEY